MKQFLNVVNFIFGSAFNLLFFAVIIAAAYIFAGRAYEYGKTLLSEDAITSVSNEISIAVPEDADAMAIGEILEESGLVKNKYVFYLQSKLNGSANYFRSGDYVLNTNMGSVMIMEELQTVQPVAKDDLRVTIVEGLTNKEIAEYLESEGYFTAEAFLNACENGNFNYGFLNESNQRENRLEGYLFPDTYNLPQNPEPEDLILRMLNRFEDIYDEQYINRTEELDMTTDEIIVMASIIEKEIKQADERALCASVIYNRLDQGINLQMCSTVLYALDKPKERLTDADLQVSSPYNTYTNPGLPAGPICNMGEAAIAAALYPADADYFYFVVKDENTGEHFFTADYNAFVQAKADYNQKY